MDSEKDLNPIFKKPLSLKELWKNTGKVWSKFNSQMLLVFFLFFIPVLVFLAIAFRNELVYTKEQLKRLLQYHSLILSFIEEIFSGALLLYVMAYFEKKLIFPQLFFRRIAFLLLPLILTISMTFFLILSGLLLFIVPGLIAAYFLVFSNLLVFHENIFGVLALRESFRLVKSAWFRVLSITLLVELILEGSEWGLFYLSNFISWPRVEIQFFTVNLLVYFIKFFGYLFFAVFFYNLRQVMMPKEKIEKPVQDLD